ncbi:MAG: DUF1549 domain-containing protein [Verrucomicrobiota bacterium]|nr:DUF1549 domain-containing protein [Verrucomicrobiota bacterium]
MHPIARALCFPFAAGLLTAPGALASVEDRLNFFEKKIRPALVEHCYRCHSAEAEKKGKLKGKLRLDFREGIRGKGESGLAAVVPSDPDKSNLYRAITYLDSELVMPPKSRLPKSIVTDFKQWIKMGATDPRDGQLAQAEAKEIKFEVARKFWSFQKLNEPKLPTVQNGAWPREDSDFFILSQLEKNHLRPAPVTDKRTLIRRATYDLTGLPPTIAEIEAFLSDKSPNAFSKTIERLLASPHYGEKWGRHWLDVARYADSNGLDENLAYVNAFRYRNYVINSFNEDKPYNRFVQEQIAGDLLPLNKNEPDELRHSRLIATGFLSVGAKMLAEDDGRKMEMDIIDEQLDTLGRAFMGMTIGCARCHDHKFDPIPTRDYYSLAGIFKSTHTMDNHKVVAQWHEVELGSADLRAKRELVDKEVKKQKQTIESLKSESTKSITAQARSVAADYLIGALVKLRKEARIQSTLKELEEQPKEKTEGMLLIEAENFTRGNGLKTFDGYGKGIGVLLSSGPTQIEFDLPIEKAGKYSLHLRYAAADSRPAKLSINNKLINEMATGSVTGTWYPDSQKWFWEGTFQLDAGINVLKLDWATPTPHIDKLLILPSDQSDHPAADSLAHLHNTFTQQWIAHLKQISKDKKSPLDEWRKYIENPRNPIDGKLIENIRSRFAAPYERDSLHSLIHDKNGPFKTPKSIEKLFTKKDQEELKQLQKQLSDTEKKYPKVPKAMAVKEGNAEDLKVHLRGDYMTQGELAPRGYLRVITSKQTTTPSRNASGRTGFAEWLTSNENPLTARVMANRIWLWHFGAGIVRTPDNFGKLGLRPTHPKLLDWLTIRFINNGWSIKNMHRIIMNSAAYQMSSQQNEEAYAMDPDNKLWWRFNRRRLYAEEVRDSLLFTGGSIDWGMKGQLMTYDPRQYVSQNNHPYFYGSSRTVYLPVIRSGTFDVLQAFDFGDPAVIQGQRSSTVNAAQALFMMNHDLVAKASERLAKRAAKALDFAESANQIYATILHRKPSAAETRRAVDFAEHAVDQAGDDALKAKAQAWKSFAQVLFSSNEFMFLD